MACRCRKKSGKKNEYGMIQDVIKLLKIEYIGSANNAFDSFEVSSRGYTGYWLPTQEDSEEAFEMHFWKSTIGLHTSDKETCLPVRLVKD